MANDPAMATLNHTMKEISQSLKSQFRILEAINYNIVEVAKRLPILHTEDPKPPAYYGWLAAELAEAEGTLCLGDIKCDANERISYWSTTGWIPLYKQRVQAP